MSLIKLYMKRKCTFFLYSDSDTGNPLVSELQEDFEPGELYIPKPTRNVKKTEFGLPRSSDIEIDKTVPEDYDMKQTNDEFDSTINSEISELTSDAYDACTGFDTKWRRSPEGIKMFRSLFILTRIFFNVINLISFIFLGGEDVSVVSQTLDYSNSTAYDDSTSVTSSNVHMELLVSKQSPSSNVSNPSDSEETHTSNSVKKEKEKKKKNKNKVSALSFV